MVFHPQQCLAAQIDTVNWFDFWLNGRTILDEATAIRCDGGP